MAQSVRTYIHKRFSTIARLATIMGVSVALVGSFVFYSKIKMSRDLEMLNKSVSVASTVQDLSSEIAMFSVRGDSKSAGNAGKKIDQLQDKSFLSALPPEKKKTFMAETAQIKILGRALLGIKSSTARQQLALSVQNLAQETSSEVVFPFIENLQEKVSKESTVVTGAFGFLVGLSVFLAGILVVLVVKVLRNIDTSVLDPLDKVSGLAGRASRLDFSNMEAGSSHFEEIDSLSISLKNLAQTFRSVLDNLPDVGVVVAEADPEMNNKIIYQNGFFERLYPVIRPGLETMLKKSLPGNMVGQSIHIMHPNPSRIKDILRSLQPGKARENMVIPVDSYMVGSSTLAVAGEGMETTLYVTLWQDKTASYTLKDSIVKTSGNLEKILGVKKEFDSVVSIAEEGLVKVKESFALSGSVVKAMEKMGNTVSQTRDNMQGIRKQVLEFQEEIRSISNIVDSISKIAAQTHVLSLNAAIEAARAGDDGRGFMVVADSVRDLAKNTEELTGSIGEKISRAVGETEKIATLISSLDAGTRSSKDLATEAETQFSSFETIVKDVGESYKTIADKTKVGVGSLDVVNEAVTSFEKLKGVKI